MEVFTVLEAQAAIYLEGADGQPSGAAIWQSGCVEGVRMEADYEERRLESHGRAHAAVHHVDESHVVSITRWWGAGEEDGEPVGPDLDRFQRYILVLVFWAEARRHWVKRVYRGVTARSQPVEDGDAALTDDKIFRAESRVQIRGLDTVPDLSGVLVASAIHVDGAGAETLAYTYDFDAEQWTSTGLVPAGTLGINEGAAGAPAGTEWYLALGGQVTLWLESGVTRAASLRAANDFLLPGPGGARAEIRLGATRYLAAMASGEVICRHLAEAGGFARRHDDILLRDGGGDWRCTLRPGGIRAEQFTEGPP